MTDIKKAVSALQVDLWVIAGFALGSFEHWFTALLCVFIGLIHHHERRKQNES